MLLKILPAVSLAVWFFAALGLLPSLVRIYRNREHAADEWRAVCLYAAGLFVAFNVRRLALGDDPTGLPGLYAISIALGVYVLVLLYRKWRG